MWSAVLVAQYHFKGLGVVGLEIHFHRRSAFWKSIYRRWPYTCRRLGAFLATASKKKQQTNKKKLGYHSVRSNGSTSARASGNGGVGNKLCRKNPPDGAVTCPLDGPAPDAVNQKKKEILVYSRSPVDSNTKSNLAQRPNIGEWDGPKSSRAIVGRPRKTRW